MALSAGIGAAATLFGAKSASDAAQNAANTQANAAKDANNTQLQMYNQTRADQQPWMQSGQAALGQLNQQMPSLTKNFSMSDFHADPGYNFAMQQGNQAIERSAAARGGLNSGDTMKALDSYSQGLGAQQYQSAYNRFTNNQNNTYNKLSTLAGVGQVANGQVANAGSNAANQIGQNQIGAANANAAATIGSANAVNNGINQGMNTWMQASMMNRMFPGTPGGGGGGGVQTAGESYLPAENLA